MSSSPGARRSPTSLVGLLLLVAIIVVGGAVLVVSGAGARVVESLYPPIAVTEQGAKIRNLYDIVFLIAAAIFFLVEGLIVWTVVRYRRRPQDVELPPQTHGNAIAEIVWTVVPTIIVAFMFVLSWQTLNEVDAPVAQPDIKIRAVAGQFQWQFDYMPSDYDPKPGEAGPDAALPAVRAGGPRRRPHRPDRADRPAVPDQPGRHPRVLRAAVPVQARRRAWSCEQVRLQGR